MKSPQSGLDRIGAFCQKGVEDALDHRFESFRFLVVDIFGWLYEWWNYLYPTGSCHHLHTDRNYSGTKTTGVI